MKITHLSTAVLEANFDWNFIKIESEEGIVGYGEVFLGPGLTGVIREFEPLLLGEDPTSIDRLMRRLRASCVHASPGLVYHAMMGIEAALLDMIGKRYKMPLWQILGGKYREEIPIYADCHAGDALESINPLLLPRTPQWMKTGGEDEERKSVISVKHHGWDASRPELLTPESYARQATDMVEKGFRMLKFDVDVPTPFETDEYNRDLSRLEVEYAAELAMGVRKAVGKSIELAIDCHWNYGVQAAVEMARAMEPVYLRWLEDPIPPENIRAIGEVQRNTRTPISTGENHYFRIDFERLIVEGGLRVLAPDVQKMGLWEGRKLADLAEMHFVNLTLHNISGPLGTMAGVHLAAAIPNLIALEWHAASVPFFDQLAKNYEPPIVRNGKIRVPDLPGVGVDLDEEVAYRYRKPGEKFFE
ncbi:MAG: mandelate racemase/muconate lactonizing enzyme family protein [Acidobacteria bacterium]|nr:mandelate racemase/muconate lactonizing enzyme family protein [Acidobacteriota bacterium]